MKKTIFSLLAIIALFTFSCKDSKTSEPTPDEPVVPPADTVYTKISYLCGEYAGPLSGEPNSPEYYQFQFSDSSVTINPDGTFNGSGLVYLFTIFAPAKDSLLFPAPGKYVGDDSLTANTFYCTSDPNANGYAAIYTVNDSAIEWAKTIRFLSGEITISGNSANSNFRFILKDEKSNEYLFQYTGPATIEQAH